MSNKGDKLLKATEADIARFMDKVDKLPNGCWFYTGARSRGGTSSKRKWSQKWYGSFYLNGTTVRAHRFSSEVFNKDECPKGYARDHLCEFSLCVNPEHIEVVTNEENIRRKCADYRRSVGAAIVYTVINEGAAKRLYDRGQRYEEPPWE